MLARSNPELAAVLLKEAQDDVERQWRVYSARAAMPGSGEKPDIVPPEKPMAPPEATSEAQKDEQVAVSSGGTK
jgi:pyruvate-ferredoxin/flavodoxin oxidoreductase